MIKYLHSTILLTVIIITQFFQPNGAIRPIYENDTELCPFENRVTINDLPSEMTPRINGMKYFRRMNGSKEEVVMDKANSLCRMYNLEAAEILDQDDYNEAITIVKETGWKFWINVKGKYSPQFGNFNFDFTLADGYTKIGFHDFGPQAFQDSDIPLFATTSEGCVILEPSTAHLSGVAWGKKKCSDSNHILCQYKKTCYKRSDLMKDPTRTIKRLIVIPTASESEDSGYAISTHQATWPFAKQVCEDADMQLLWFDNNEEQDNLRKVFDAFIKTKVQYQGKSFWTASRFSPNFVDAKNEIYAKLYWWKHNMAYEVPDWDLTMARLGQPESSGGFLKKWGKEREATNLNKNEPYDEGLQGVERCVDTSFQGDEGEYYTSKCEKSLRYFICKNQEVVNRLRTGQTPSFIDYCDGEAYRKTKARDCNGEIIFAGQKKPDCICYGGLHAFMADIRCKPKLLVGTGCTVLKAKSSVHWKILPGDIVAGGKPWIIVIHSSDERNEIFNWYAANIRQAEKRQILGSSTFFFSGYTLYRDTDRNDLCFVMNATSPNTNEYYEYNVPELPSVTMRYYFDNENCKSKRVSLDKMVVHEVHQEKNDCKFETCSRKEGPESSVYITLPHTVPDACVNDTSLCEADDHNENTVTDPLIEKKSSGGKAEGDIEDVNDNLNRELLVHAIETSFPASHGEGETTLAGPRNTWTVVDKLFELAKRTCSRMVSPMFFSRVLKYFKVSHYGDSFEYGEFFTDAETKQVIKMIDSCLETTHTMREMDVEVDTCTGKASRLTVENKTKEIISRSTDDTGYQTVFHHHILEATWNVIDLWNAVCISRNDYYAIRSKYTTTGNGFYSCGVVFWTFYPDTSTSAIITSRKAVSNGCMVLHNVIVVGHFPNVTEDYFQLLLGPDEGIQLLNLDQCVLAAYQKNLKTKRMNRPLNGRNTVVGQMIRNRLVEYKLKEEGIVPANNDNILSLRAKISTACIKGTAIQCRKKQTKVKKPVGMFLDIMNRG